MPPSRSRSARRQRAPQQGLQQRRRRTAIAPQTARAALPGGACSRYRGHAPGVGHRSLPLDATDAQSAPQHCAVAETIRPPAALTAGGLHPTGSRHRFAQRCTCAQAAHTPLSRTNGGKQGAWAFGQLLATLETGARARGWVAAAAAHRLQNRASRVLHPSGSQPHSLQAAGRTDTQGCEAPTPTQRRPREGHTSAALRE